MTYLGWLASGTMWTLLVSIFAWIIAFTLGSVLGVLRTTPLRIPKALATAYVEVFRNIPLLVQMFLWYFVMPEVVPKAVGDWLKQDLPNLVELPFAQFSMWEFTAAVLCLGLYTASRVAEQVRAGILSLPRGQTNAGLAMGFTPAAGLPLRAAADGLPAHHPADDLRVPHHLQELVHGAHHRRDRADRARAARSRSTRSRPSRPSPRRP